MLIICAPPGAVLNSLNVTLSDLQSWLVQYTYCGRMPGCVRLPASYVDDELRMLEMNPLLQGSAKARKQRLRGMCTSAGLADPILSAQSSEYQFALAGVPPMGS